MTNEEIKKQIEDLEREILFLQQDFTDMNLKEKYGVEEDIHQMRRQIETLVEKFNA